MLNLTTPSFVLNNDNDKNVSTAIHVVSNVAGVDPCVIKRNNSPTP